MSHFKSARLVLAPAFCLLTLASATALAAEARFAAPVDPVAPGAGTGMLRVFLALVLILGLIFAAAWLLRRVRVAQGASGSGIQVLSQVSLGARERAVLIRVAGRELLLGVAPGNVRTLLLLEQGNAAKGLSGDAVPAGTPAGIVPQRFDFREILKRSLGK